MPGAERSIRPLDGVQVVVTRLETAEGPLTGELAKRGATVLHWPAIRFEPEDPVHLDAALERLASYQGVVFTSPRAVAAVSSRMRPPETGPWIAAVGEATRQALERAGWRAEMVPAATSSSGLAEELTELITPGSRILFPASSIARETLPRALRELGAEVDQVTAYRTVANECLDLESCRAVLTEATPTVITFASPSAIRALRSRFGRSAFADLLSRWPSAVIGATTAAALRRAGGEPAAVATESTMAGLAEAAERAAPRRKEA